jgi:dolichol-phosphate mannosyltransferase
MKQVLLILVGVIQVILATQFFKRAWISRNTSERIPATGPSADEATISVIVPVLNEVNRVGYCLETLVRQDRSVDEILVVDGGSVDGTQDLVARYSRTDDRVRLVEAGNRPDGWNGKAWNLQVGLDQASSHSSHIVTVDADVILADGVIGRSVLFAKERGIPFMSIGIRQSAPSAGLSLVHPSLLSTLAYRFGLPGRLAESLGDVQANGQLAVYERVPLVRAGGFQIARDSICEDVTLARHLYLSGYRVGFYLSDCDTLTQMHTSAIECIQNWPRSLGLRDRFDRSSGYRTIASTFFLQVLPPLAMLNRSVGIVPAVFRTINAVLIAARLGILFGTRDTYVQPSWTFWLSPLADPLSLIVIALNQVRRNHVWRGQLLVEQEIDR